MSAIKAVRVTRAEMNVPAAKKPSLIIVTDKTAIFESGVVYLSKLAYASDVVIRDTAPEEIAGMVSAVTDEAKMFMPMAELVDLEKERARIEKELEAARKGLAAQTAKLSNENFVSRAPENVVNAERDKQAKFESLIANLEESLQNLK